MPVKPLDAQQWCLYANKASRSAVVALGANKDQLIPRTIGRLPNWLAKISPKYIAQQAYQYQDLADSFKQASRADDDMVNDQALQDALTKLLALIENKANLSDHNSLRWGELRPLLVQWRAALRAVEIKKAQRINHSCKATLTQLDGSGPSVGIQKEDLAKALLLPGPPPSQPASSDSAPSQLQVVALETVFNAVMDPPPDCSAVADTAEGKAAIQQKRELEQAASAAKAAAADKALSQAGLSDLQDVFMQAALHVRDLKRIEADCKAYFDVVRSGKKPSRQQTEAMRTVASLGSIELTEAEGKARFGSAYTAPGVKNHGQFPRDIRLGFAALNALTALNQILTRCCSMDLCELERMARQPVPQGKEARDAYFKRIEGLCGGLQKSLRTNVEELSTMSASLAQLSEFSSMPPHQRLILSRYGDHLEVLLQCLAGRSLPNSTAPNPYKAAYQLAELGKDQPKAARDLLSGALQYAEGDTQPPARSDASKRLVSQDSRVTFSIDDSEDKAENDRELATLMKELDPLYASTGSSIKNAQDQARDELAELLDELEELAERKDAKDLPHTPAEDMDTLIDDLEHWDDGRANSPRPTSQAMNQHMQVVNGLYRSEVPQSQAVDIPDPGSLLERRPTPSPREEQHPMRGSIGLRPVAKEPSPANDAVKRAPRSKELKRERSNRVRAGRIRKVQSVPTSTPKNEVTRKTSAVLKPHLKKLELETLTDNAMGPSLGIGSDGSSSDEAMQELMGEMASTSLLSPNSLTQSRRAQDKKDAKRSRLERSQKATDSANAVPTESTFEEVDWLLNKMQAAALPLNDTSPRQPLVDPIVPEYTRERQYLSPRTSRKRVSEFYDRFEAQQKATTEAQLADSAKAVKAKAKAAKAEAKAKAAKAKAEASAKVKTKTPPATAISTSGTA